MNNKLLKCFLRYLPSVVLGALLVFAIKIIPLMNIKVDNGDSMLQFDATDIYLMVFWPVISLLHGVLTCIITRRMFVPSFVLSVSVWFVLLVGSYKSISFLDAFSIEALIWPLITLCFSFVFALITKVVVKFIKMIRAEIIAENNM